MFQKIELRKTRDFAAKINVTFDFIRQNFAILAKSQLYISGPFILLQGLFMGLYQHRALSLGRMTNVLDSFRDKWFILSMIFLWIAYTIELIIVNEFARQYETRQDPRTIEITELWDAVKANFLRMFLAGIVASLLSGFAALLLLLPGIYVAVTLSLAAPVLIIEQKSIGESISRCFRLITEKWWSTFGLLVVCTLLIWVMGLVFQFPSLIFTEIVGIHKTSGTMNELPLWQQFGIMSTSILASVGSNLLQTIIFLSLVFQFYNLVERKEAQGLMNKLESFGKADANPQQNDETY